MKCRAVPDGDGFVLNGAKLWITNAQQAEIFLVFATVNPEAGYKGITAFIIERDCPGFSTGTPFHKMGVRASATSEVILDNCEVPEENKYDF